MNKDQLEQTKVDYWAYCESDVDVTESEIDYVAGKDGNREHACWFIASRKMYKIGGGR